MPTSHPPRRMCGRLLILSVSRRLSATDTDPSSIHPGNHAVRDSSTMATRVSAGEASARVLQRASGMRPPVTLGCWRLIHYGRPANEQVRGGIPERESCPDQVSPESAYGAAQPFARETATARELRAFTRSRGSSGQTVGFSPPRGYQPQPAQCVYPHLTSPNAAVRPEGLPGPPVPKRDRARDVTLPSPRCCTLDKHPSWRRTQCRTSRTCGWQLGSVRSVPVGCSSQASSDGST